jgi:Protein of unknown function (DUF2877)
MSVPFPFGKVDSIGARANALLSRPDFHGRVLAVVSSAVYLTSSDDEILWLGKSDLPRHPRAILGPFDPRAFRVGMTFRRDGTRLQFDAAKLDWADAPVWRPASILPEQVAPRDVIRARLGQLNEIARADDAADAAPNPFARAAAAPKAEIARACRDRDLVRVLETGRALIGLGAGLTPAGDDFLGGWLFVAYHLNALCPGVFDWDHRAIDAWLEWARGRTNPISYAILCDHAAGQGVEPLVNLLAAVLKGEKSNDLVLHAQRLRAIGGTSGREMFAGATTALLMVVTT